MNKTITNLVEPWLEFIGLTLNTLLKTFTLVAVIFIVKDKQWHKLLGVG